MELPGEVLRIVQEALPEGILQYPFWQGFGEILWQFSVAAAATR
jgi:hypothetical protein